MAERAMRLDEVACALGAAGLLTAVRGAVEGVVRGVAHDSRKVQPGDLFVAWVGTASDGHRFAPDAVRAGAVALVVEEPLDSLDVPQLVVTNGRRSAALAADLFYGSPWSRLTLVAVTGTNGKTTTVVIARRLLAALGPSASLGTLGLMGPDGNVWPGTEELTTPGPVEFTRWLAELAHQGVVAVALEASSHALAQHRLDGARFDVAVYTNLSRDHLDYHGSFEDYFAAKARLIELLKPESVVVANAGDPAWARLPTGGRRVLRFSTDGTGDVRAARVQVREGGTSFVLHAGSQAVDVSLPLAGRYNVENALAAAAAALACGVPVGEIPPRLASVEQVPGRLERVSDEPCPVFIDFAHTPAALERAIGALRPLARGRLILVFGAGGDRDPGKRPEMGLVAGRLADLTIVTSDNPRTEDPERIIDDILRGMKSARHERITDRRAAIGRALELARAGDVVLLAGKGHERYQVLGRRKVPFDEREIVRAWLRGANEVSRGVPSVE